MTASPQKKSPLAASLIVLFVIAVFVFAGGLWYVRQPAGNGSHAVRVTVADGETVPTVASELEQKHLIVSAFYFGWVGRHSLIKPGVYDIAPNERPDRILHRLHIGDVATVRVTIPEGFRITQIAHRLQRLGVLSDGNAFLDFATQQGGTLKASFPLPANLEGYLYPDTYRLPIGASPAQIAQRMVDEFDRLMARGKAEDITASHRPLGDLVNVAAMIEREAETDGDRPKIAGVIYNRLAKSMKLEMDATVQYARSEHTSRLMNSDLAIDSPYNTYKHAGLPPGPICSPGLPSLEAAMHPEASDYLYYVTGPDGKSHVFARTLAEHDQNVARYRKSAAAARAAAEAAAKSAPATTP